MAHPNVSPELITIAIAACPPMQRIYLAGGGSMRDLRTHMGHALAAALSANVAQSRSPVIDLVGRRRSQKSYSGWERRQTA